MVHLLHTPFLPSTSSTTLRRSSASSGSRRPPPSAGVVRTKIREIFMPALSSTTTEGKRVSWVKSEGDKLSKGESVVVVESDKADMDVETIYDGYLAAIMVDEGSVAARAKQLQPHEYSTGTFTLSNLGMFGVDRFDAILPPGTGAIMAVGSSQPTVVATKDGRIGYQGWLHLKIVNDFTTENLEDGGWLSRLAYTFLFWQTLSVVSPGLSYASDSMKMNEIYAVGELFDLSIQLLYLLSLLGLLGVGTYFVIRQVLVRRELDLSAKELQEQVRSGDASATELFELGAVMLRRKFYPAATKFLLQAIEKWDGDKQDLAQVYNALGVSYVRDGKVDKGIAQFEMAVKLQPGYVTAWNNLGDAFENKKEYKAALKAFEEVLLFDPNNKIARPRRDALKDQVEMYKGVPIKSKEK
ncbi:hypothetical protein PIB30_053747 [Stylosanthes scabra]|uniref:Lipoyl-binding domain-containing protein n=1 Tax=Stylosanthes scabra TaxID=79078 RepID=A0ABU6RIX7_9FABA|nr:hypothetical protein [Stylosanthes scabra]